ncbi:MAG TPA: cupredoxin domain-containing protein, partial [Patescibacteria group bacterium]
IAAVGVMLWLGNQKNLNQAAKVVPTITQAATIVPSVTQSATVSGAATAVQEFTVEGGSYYFKPNIIKVKKGDTVKITFNSAGGVHDFVIDEYKIKSEKITSGNSTVINFVADKIGTFAYYCSIGNHREMGMVGKLIVE